MKEMELELRSEANKKMSEALTQLTNIDLVFAHNDEMAVGASEAIGSNKNPKRPIIIGIDALPGVNGGIERVLDGG